MLHDRIQMNIHLSTGTMAHVRDRRRCSKCFTLDAIENESEIEHFFGLKLILIQAFGFLTLRGRHTPNETRR